MSSRPLRAGAGGQHHVSLVGYGHRDPIPVHGFAGIAGHQHRQRFGDLHSLWLIYQRGGDDQSVVGEGDRHATGVDFSRKQSFAGLCWANHRRLVESRQPRLALGQREVDAAGEQSRLYGNIGSLVPATVMDGVVVAPFAGHGHVASWWHALDAIGAQFIAPSAVGLALDAGNQY